MHRVECLRLVAAALGPVLFVGMGSGAGGAARLPFRTRGRASRDPHANVFEVPAHQTADAHRSRQTPGTIVRAKRAESDAEHRGEVFGTHEQRRGGGVWGHGEGEQVSHARPPSPMMARRAG